MNLVHWLVTLKCNHNCYYCFFKLKPDNNKILSNDAIVDFWNNTNKIWDFKLTGGEPFLYPDFIDLCGKLTQSNHTIFIDTNLSLSLDELHKFIQKVSTDKVGLILASMNNKNEQDIEPFIEKARLLMEKGYRFDSTYVLHPLRYDKVDETTAILNRNNIPLTVQRFLGKYGGKEYPTCYDKEILEKYFPEGLKDNCFNPKEKSAVCGAGYNYVYVNPDYEIYSCMPYSNKKENKIGDISLNKIKLGTGYKQCNLNTSCPCLNMLVCADIIKL